MKEIIVFLGVIALLLGACSTSTHPTSGDTKTISWPPLEPLSSQLLIDSVELVSFEVSDSALLGYPVFVNYTTDKIYIIGNESGAGIKVFDCQGKYLNQIGQKGRGPGEYLNVLGWNVWRDTVYIGDYMQNKLLVYRSDGQLLSEIQLPEKIRKGLGDKNVSGMVVAPLEKGFFITPIRNMLDKDISVMKRDFVMTDFQFNVQETLVKAAAEEDQTGFLVNVNRKSGDTLTILNRQGKMLARFRFDFGSEQITPQIWNQLTLSELLQNKTFIVRALICDDLVFMDMKSKGKTERWIFDWKKERFYRNTDGAGMRDKILNHLAVCPRERSIVSLIVSPRSTGFKELPATLRTSLEEDGGAVLVKYHLKQIN